MMKKTLFFCALLLCIIPLIGFAQSVPNEPKWLIDLPVTTNLDPTQENLGSFSNYMNLLYTMSISLAAMLAVIKIIIAGVKYMLSDVVSSKGDALKDIRGALFGLILILSAVLILNVINPSLVTSKVKFNAQPPADLTRQPPPVAPTTNGTTPAPGGVTPLTISSTAPGGTIPPITSNPDGSTTPVIAKCNPEIKPIQNGNNVIYTINLNNCNKTQKDPALSNLTPFNFYLNVNFKSQCEFDSSNKGTITPIPGKRDEFQCIVRKR